MAKQKVSGGNSLLSEKLGIFLNRWAKDHIASFGGVAFFGRCTYVWYGGIPSFPLAHVWLSPSAEACIIFSWQPNPGPHILGPIPGQARYVCKSQNSVAPLKRTVGEIPSGQQNIIDSIGEERMFFFLLPPCTVKNVIPYTWSACKQQTPPRSPPSTQSIPTPWQEIWRA